MEQNISRKLQKKRLKVSHLMLLAHQYPNLLRVPIVMQRLSLPKIRMKNQTKRKKTKIHRLKTKMETSSSDHSLHTCFSTIIDVQSWEMNILVSSIFFCWIVCRFAAHRSFKIDWLRMGKTEWIIEKGKQSFRHLNL